jgi:two-component system sensor histidine kinase KdpD
MWAGPHDGLRRWANKLSQSISIAHFAISFALVMLSTSVLLTIDSYLATQHLILGYLLPTVFVAIYYGSTLAVLSAFLGGMAADYFLFPPKFSFYIADHAHVAELGFFLLLAWIASKAVAVIAQPRDAPRGY